MIINQQDCGCPQSWVRSGERQLIDGYYPTLVWKQQDLENCSNHSLHSISPTLSLQEVIVERSIDYLYLDTHGRPPNCMGKEGMIPCGQNKRSSKSVRRVGDGDKTSWPMVFQHANDITHVEAPLSTTVWKIFHVKKIVG
jgi:hypothetical protein